MITGIVVALPEELTTLTAKRIDKGHCVFVADKLLAAYAGVGAKNASAAAELLLGKGASQLLSWGCAAALSSALAPGDLVLASTLIDVDDADLAVNPRWHAHAQAILAQTPIRLHTGKLAESANIIVAGKEKQQLHTFTKAIAVDMESVAVAKTAAHNNLPFLAIKAIADPADMDLPQAVVRALNAQGDIVMSRLLLSLLSRPAQIPRLIRLGIYFNAAQATLKRVSLALDQLADFKTT